MLKSRGPAFAEERQFAKDTFAYDVAPAMHGALAWQDPPETRLLKVQADGMLLVRRPDLLPQLEPPWSAMEGHDETLLEVKMAGDHTGPKAVERILLRRQARQVERMEARGQPTWTGMEPVWVSAPRVPPSLRARYQVRRFARGCYRIDPAAYSFVWIAANELPLRDDLIPFLLTRSGKALDAFGVWVADRKPAQWVLNMLKCVAMSQAAREMVFHYVKDDRPEVRERRRHVLKLLLASEPDVAQQLKEEGRAAEARSSLRRVLARRGLLVSPADDARVDACTDLTTLERWHDEAVVATTAAEVFGAPAKKRRPTARRGT